VSRAWYPLRTFPLTVASAVWTPRRWFSFLAPSQSAEPDRWFTESPLGHEHVLYDDHHVPDGEHDHHRRHQRQCHPGHREPGRTTLTEVGTVTGVAKTQGHLTVRAVTSKPIDEVTVLIQDAVTAAGQALVRRAACEGQWDVELVLIDPKAGPTPTATPAPRLTPAPTETPAPRPTGAGR
jgi:hypothetical protein